MVQIASSHPLDTIKTRLQAEGGQRYASALDVLTKTVRSEGVLALYKGMLYPLVGNAFVNSALFAIFGRISHFLHPDSTTPTPISVVAISGAGAGLLQSVIASPVGAHHPHRCSSTLPLLIVCRNGQDSHADTVRW